MHYQIRHVTDREAKSLTNEDRQIAEAFPDEHNDYGKTWTITKNGFYVYEMVLPHFGPDYCHDPEDGPFNPYEIFDEFGPYPTEKAAALAARSKNKFAEIKLSDEADW